MSQSKMNMCIAKDAAKDVEKKSFANFPALRALAVASAVSMSLALSGCAVPPAKSADAMPVKAGLQDYLQDAGKARTEGSRDKSRDLYRIAAKAYPTSKEPWVKLSEDYFEGADYGNAILAAQEVLARDGADTVGASVLAVSGLRVSASALQVLRSQNPIADNTRSEAQSMARTLREVLGEPVLVPATTPAPAKPKRRVPTPAPVKQADATPASASPFDKLR